MHEGDRLPATLYALLSGSLQVVQQQRAKLFSVPLPAGEIFAAPALWVMELPQRR